MTCPLKLACLSLESAPAIDNTILYVHCKLACIKLLRYPHLAAIFLPEASSISTRSEMCMCLCLTGLQLAPRILKALEEVDPEQKAERVPNKAYSKIYEQAGACLATAVRARAVQALHAAAQAHQISGSPASSSGRAGTSTGRSTSSSSTVWQRVQQLSEEAVKHMDSVQCAQDLHSSVRVACMASLAPAAAELRYLTALQGQHELQASLDRIFAESWPQQPFPAALHSAFGGCQLSQMLSPEVSACLADGMISELGPGQTGQQLRQRAADSALQPLQESWRSFHRGALHLLAASRLQREGAVFHHQDIEAWRSPLPVASDHGCTNTSQYGVRGYYILGKALSCMVAC